MPPHRGASSAAGESRRALLDESADAFLGVIALHGGHLGGTTSRLLRLLDRYGATQLDAAIALALAIWLGAGHAALAQQFQFYLRNGDRLTGLTGTSGWLDGSNETVTIELTKKTHVYAMVHGYESMSDDSASFSISGRLAP